MLLFRSYINLVFPPKNIAFSTIVVNLFMQNYLDMEGQSGQKEHFLISINDFLISINNFLTLINGMIH